jgi:hypothetical protein
MAEEPAAVLVSIELAALLVVVVAAERERVAAVEQSLGPVAR